MNAKQLLTAALAVVIVAAGAGAATAISTDAQTSTHVQADEKADTTPSENETAANETHDGPDENASDTAHTVHGIITEWLNGDLDGPLGPHIADAVANSDNAGGVDAADEEADDAAEQSDDADDQADDADDQSEDADEQADGADEQSEDANDVTENGQSDEYQPDGTGDDATDEDDEHADA